MSYEHAFWCEITTTGESKAEIALAWNADDDLVLAVGDAYPIGYDDRILCDGGQNGDLDTNIQRVINISMAYPRALFALTAEGGDYGDWPVIVYIRNGLYYTATYRPPPFDETKLRKGPLS